MTHDEQSTKESRGDEASSEAQSSTAPESATGANSNEERAPLFASDEADGFRERWQSLQAGFVDRPRQTVEEADDLVAELMQRLTAGFSDKRSQLEQHWEQGDQVSTEELRVALTRYRSFFNRLLSA